MQQAQRQVVAVNSAILQVQQAQEECGTWHVPPFAQQATSRQARAPARIERQTLSIELRAHVRTVSSYSTARRTERAQWYNVQGMHRAESRISAHTWIAPR